MTCIVGLKDKGRVYMGADSAGVSSGWDLVQRIDPKVFHNGQFLIGFTTSFRMGQLLRFELTPPQQEPALKPYAYMVKRFIPAVRTCLKDGGYAEKHNEKESGGAFLVGYQGELFEVCGDYQVGMNLAPFAAVGCGAQVALGAMHASQSRPPEERIRIALEAAERFSAGVRGPFLVEST